MPPSRRSARTRSKPSRCSSNAKSLSCANSSPAAWPPPASKLWRANRRDRKTPGRITLWRNSLVRDNARPPGPLPQERVNHSPLSREIHEFKPLNRGKTSNVQHRTPNIEVNEDARCHSMFGVGCSMLDVPMDPWGEGRGEGEQLIPLYSICSAHSSRRRALRRQKFIRENSCNSCLLVSIRG